MKDMRKEITSYIQKREFIAAASLVCAFTCFAGALQSDSKIVGFVLFFMIGVLCRFTVNMASKAGAALALREMHDALQEIESERWEDGK